jgi:hypothetical protein
VSEPQAFISTIEMQELGPSPSRSMLPSRRRCDDQTIVQEEQYEELARVAGAGPNNEM